MYIKEKIYSKRKTLKYRNDQYTNKTLKYRNDQYTNM